MKVWVETDRISPDATYEVQGRTFKFPAQKEEALGLSRLWSGARLAAGRYSSSIRVGRAVRSYRKGLTAQVIMARARQNNVSPEAIVTSFRQARDKEHLFNEWQKLQLIDQAEKRSLASEAAENLVLGVWYAVSEGVYP